MSEAATTSSTSGGASYEVLARRHRPLGFDGVIGQEALVRTLRNAFDGARIAHAFVLSGIRGVGKTTTARIIARCLNCTGAGDGPTFQPCGACEACTAIAESRFADVIELDAASHTQVEKIRELIENAHFRPNWGRFKVYIIDEAHMLSTASFNALLKTLEEPPPHAKFILATTEANKIPVTVLSRCQRFELRRVDAGLLAKHLAKVADSEGVAIEEDAVSLLVRASSGSVRDALSMLDQAIAHGGTTVAAASVREMLGMADGQRVLDLFEKLCAGDVGGALEEFDQQYRAGADPAAVLGSLAEACHRAALLRVAPEMAESPEETPESAARERDLARRLGTAGLVRLWQVLDRSIEEVRRAEHPKLSADMAIIRLTHVSGLPTPEEIARQLEGNCEATLQPAAAAGTPAESTAGASGEIDTPERLVSLAREHSKGKIAFEIQRAEIQKFEPGVLEFVPNSDAPRTLARELKELLDTSTSREWKVLALSKEDIGGGDANSAQPSPEDASVRQAGQSPNAAGKQEGNGAPPPEPDSGGERDIVSELAGLLPSGTEISVIADGDGAQPQTEETVK